MSLNPVYQRSYPVLDMSTPYAGNSLLPGSQMPLADASTSQNVTEVDIQIRNVVCNYSLPLHIDLRRVAMNTGNVEFARNRGFLFKQKRNPACLVKIFSTGKVCIVGCRSEEECKKAARQIARLVQRSMDKLNQVVRLRDYRITNVFATCKMPFGVKIEEIAQQYPQTNYEPELSVGLIWKNDEPKATLRIHTTGSITITGATSEASVEKVMQKFYPILKKFACPSRHGDLSYSSHQLQRNPASRKRIFVTPIAYNNGAPSNEFYASKRTRTMVAGGYANRMAATSIEQSTSTGMYGDKMYFSDEEDLYEEFYFDDKNVGGAGDIELE